MIEELHDRIMNIQTKSPTLLLGDCAKVFRDNYRGEIISFNDIDTFKHIYENFNYSCNRLIVVENFSFLIKTPFFKMFLDKVSFPIIFLAEDTEVSDELLSAMKTVVKVPYPTTSNMLGAIKAQQKWKEYEDKSNIKHFYAEESPELFYFKSKYSMSKYVDLFATDNVS